MELQFTRIEKLKVYVAEAMVNANFNIHFERAASGGGEDLSEDNWRNGRYG
ncbi:hypothetical protein NXX89_16275 [Bacteroides thetaiotaomicron]|nr:hypothetical protein [Bacteroides thetaiotaomicron]MCS3212915.1 hypothetical protein [Bacteroides thetaiotaomicron]